MPEKDSKDGASFRDPSGFVFHREGTLLRQVNQAYRREYDHLVSSRLLETLVSKRLLVPHEEIQEAPLEAETSYKVIKPYRIPFVSYPYEWCFSQLKDAALLTLRVQSEALASGMSLKDSSAYNVQFLGGRPVFIDTLSFEVYEEGKPWVAYKQFCEHFLAPLSLMAKTDRSLNQLLRTNVGGVPLGIAARLLPWRSRLSLSLGAHIHLHAASLDRHGGDRAPRTVRLSKFKLLALLDSLGSAVMRLRCKEMKSEWSDYYQDTNYTPAGLRHKELVVNEFLGDIAPRTAWDFGANTGVFSQAANARGAYTLALDVDSECVERLYRQVKEEANESLLPLVMDLANPSPGIGWHNQERLSIWSRGPTDLGLALALVHHLAIGNNVPFDSIARCFASVCRFLIVEFVPKQDSQIQRLLVSRKDIFDNYTQDAFEAQFGKRFATQRREKIKDSERCLYLMRNLSQPG